jgi:hypothetical protein
MGKDHEGLQNTIDMVCHGLHVVRYVHSWQDQKSLLDKRLRALIKYLDRNQLNLVQLATRDREELEKNFNDPLMMGLIYLLAASKHQENVCHLQREDSAEARDLATSQRQRVLELLNLVCERYSDYLNVSEVHKWAAANKGQYDGPEHAP